MEKKRTEPVARQRAALGIFAFIALLVTLTVYQTVFAQPGGFPFLGKWGIYGSGAGQFMSPYSVAVDGQGDVYVADTYNYRIQKFDSDGAPILQWGTEGDGQSEFNLPTGVAVDGQGNVYVADRNNDRIQKFDGSGGFLLQWGESGTGDGKFNGPYTVAVDAQGYVYVADGGNRRIQKFDSQGGFEMAWGGAGVADGQFLFARGVTAGWPSTVYTTDSLLHRAQKFSDVGVFGLKWGESGTDAGKFNSPAGLSVDGDGYVYIADAYNCRIQGFDSSGQNPFEWGEKGKGDGEFRAPLGIAVDGAGNVYVADTKNHRIQKFEGAGATISLSARKTADPQTSVPYHSLVTYTIVLSNSGVSSAMGVALTDTLPSQSDFATWVENSQGATVDNDKLTWQGGITAGEAITFSFVVTHVGGFGDVVDNEAEYDHFTGSGAINAVFRVNGPPELSLSKTLSPEGQIEYHNPVTYTIILSNGGESDAVGALLTDELPSEVTFAEWIRQPSGAQVVDETLTWQGVATSGKAITFTFVATHVGDYGDVVDNEAEYEHFTGSGVDEAAFRVKGTPELSLSKTSSPEGQIEFHNPVTYTVVLSNGGESDAAGVLLTDELPSGVTFAEWIRQPPGAQVVDETLTWQGVATSGKAITVTFVVSHTGAHGDMVVNEAEYAHLTGSGSDAVTFTVGAPDLSIIKTAEPESGIAVGNSVTYTIVLNNEGMGTAHGVMLTDRLPEQVGFAQWLNQPQGAVVTDGELTWQGTVIAATPVTFAFVTGYLGGEGDVVTNTVEITHTSATASAQAVFLVTTSFNVYLPVVLK